MRPTGDGRAQRGSSIQQEGRSSGVLARPTWSSTERTWRNWMHADESNDSQPADAAGVHATAIDVHNHAMLPLLEWLERAGLSDLSRVGGGGGPAGPGGGRA